MACRPDHRFHPLTLYSTKTEVKSYWQKLSEVHVCTNCDKPFNLLRSMGNFNCSQHPGVMQKDGTYSCCGRREAPMRFQNTRINGIFPSHNDFGRRNGYIVRNAQPLRIKRPGCQKCDCTTGTNAWKHANRIHISELAPLIPHIRQDADNNNGYWLTQRIGFDDGYVRRCEVQKLLKPEGNWEYIEYETVEGEIKKDKKEDMPHLPYFGTLIKTK